MILLQNVNPGHGTFGRPYHTYLPDWFALVIIILFITSVLYVIIRRKKRNGLEKEEIEKRALEDLLGIEQKVKKKRKRKYK
jgi:hypothetical protein